MAKGATRLARARTHPKQQPDGCRREQARPEDGMVEGRRVEVLLLRLEFPGGRAVLKHLAIPPQADHQSPRDVFTVQKSNASSSTHTMNMFTKLLENHVPNM